MVKTEKARRNSDIKLVRQETQRDGWIIGVSGDKETITCFANQIYNYGGTDNKLQYLSDDFVYFYTDSKRFAGVLKYIYKKSSATAMIRDIVDEKFLIFDNSPLF